MLKKSFFFSLKYAHVNGCRWDLYTCWYAVENGHLNCLKYAHENECNWNSNTCFYAVKKGHLDCLKYAIENNCPYYKHECISKSNPTNTPVIEYLESL